MKRRLVIVGALCLLALGTLSGAALRQRTQDARNAIPPAYHASRAARIYTGAYVPLTPWLNALLGLGPQFDFSQLASFEKDADKGVSLLEIYQNWGDRQPRFPRALLSAIRAHGSIPYLTWQSAGAATLRDQEPRGTPDQPTYTLKNIYLRHRFDAYIRQWANDAKAWGHPFFLRFDPEMNAPREPYSALENGNAIGDYVKTWDYVRQIFRQEGVTNATWVWCPTIYYPLPGFVPVSNLHQLYPGAGETDWVGVNAYNFGTGTPGSQWVTFSQIVAPTYEAIERSAPAKPMIVETGSTEAGGSKAHWITDLLQTEIPKEFPRVKALVWANYNATTVHSDNRIESSRAAMRAFRAAISSSIYASNQYARLNTSPIPPP